VPIVNLPSAPFTMSGVEPGTYLLLAYVLGRGSSNTYAGAYTVVVACGLRATCTAHSLIRVLVKPGGTTTGVDVLDWYSRDGTLPPTPTALERVASPGEAVRIYNPYADSVNVRASAGLGFPVRPTLDNRTTVAVRDGPLPAEGFRWYEVNLIGEPLARGWVVGYALRK
jgi:hypothetical protein